VCVMAAAAAVCDEGESKYDLMDVRCKELFRTYVDEKADVEKIVAAYFAFVEVLTDKKEMRLELLDPIELGPLLKTLGEILNEPFKYLHSNGVEMKQETTTFAQMLRIIGTVNTHTIREKGKCFVCPFHLESLFVHSHLAMLISLASVSTVTKDKRKLLRHAFVGLLHDVGKYGCASTLEVTNNGRTNRWTKFPGHGEIGSGIVMMAELKYFTADERVTMARAICVHMCGYHETNKNSIKAKYAWPLLRLESAAVKDYLYHLSIADRFGAYADVSVAEDAERFIKSRDDFLSAITEPFSGKEFYKANGFHGMVIFARGMSGSGKSWIGKAISDFLVEHKCSNVIVERDQFMCYVAAKSVGEYCPEKATGERYLRYLEIYRKGDMSGKVNEEMNKAINDGLAAGKVVIVDTVMTFFKAMEHAVPTSMKAAFVVAVDVIRTDPFVQADADRMGIDVAKQIKLHGERDNFYWLPKDTKSRLKQFSSISTGKIPGEFSRVQPRLVHTVTWNLGREELFRQLTELIKPLNDIDRAPIATDEDMDIVTYVNHLFGTYGFENMCEFVRSKGFTVVTPMQYKDTVFEKRIIRIKYLDNCRLWRPKWARQSRGVVLFLREDIGKWVCIKYQLQRGAEILTGLHLKAGIDETESASIKELDIFDDIQQDTIKRLLEGRDLEGILSFKSDGSLLGVGMYGGVYGEIVRSLIAISKDPLANCLVELADEMKLGFVPTLSSQATFLLGSDMYDYMVTAIAGDVEIKGESPVEMFRKIGRLFLGKIGKFYDVFRERYPEAHHDIMTLSFEARCKNRTTLWGNHHNELAISYDSSGLKVLGVSYGDTAIGYMPHQRFSDINNLVGFDEPIWWNIRHSKDIENIMIDLSKCIRRTGFDEEFVRLHPPANKYPIGKIIIDYEGFVFYRVTDTGLFDYSKIKTEEYYKAHKFKIENVKYLIALYDTASHIFPLTRTVKGFFSDTEALLSGTCVEMMRLLSEPVEKNPLYGSLIEKAKISFVKQSPETKMKMLVNASGEFKQLAFEIFNIHFPAIRRSTIDRGEIDGVIKELVMKLAPWNPAVATRLTTMIAESHQLIARLFDICLNST